MNKQEKSKKIIIKNKKAHIKLKRKKTKQKEKPTKLRHLLEKGEKIDENERSFSLDFKLARDSILEEMLVGLKNYQS